MRASFIACILLTAALDARAETFTVTRVDDPLPDACVPGDCSLREAILTANANDPFADVDVIMLPAGTYTLVRGALGDVHDPLIIQGAGSGQTHLVNNDEDASLFVSGTDGALSLIGLELDSAGGGVVALVDSSMQLDDVIVKNGDSSFNGSVEVHHSELRRTLRCTGQALIEDSRLFNLAMLPPNTGVQAVTLRRSQVDGTLYPDAPLASTVTVHLGTLTIEDSMLSDTHLVLFDVNAAVSLRDSTVTRSSIDIIAASTNLQLHRVHYIDNTGPIRTEATADVTIEDSLFEGNLVRALYAAGGAEWNVTGSSFVGNRVDGNAGGAIVLEDDTTLRVRNSTFSDNGFTSAAAAAGARGGAIGYRNGSGAHLILTHVTIVPPTTTLAGIVGTTVGGHGGGTIVDISNAILSGTCGMNAGVLQNNAGNIEAPGDSCDFDPQQNRINVDPDDVALGELGAYGGATPTYLPQAGSVAIDHGSTPQCLAVDQRGYARPGGVRCDVGAVEADADDTLFADGFEG